MRMQRQSQGCSMRLRLNRPASQQLPRKGKLAPQVPSFLHRQPLFHLGLQHGCLLMRSSRRLRQRGCLAVLLLVSSPQCRRHMCRDLSAADVPPSDLA